MRKKMAQVKPSLHEKLVTWVIRGNQPELTHQTHDLDHKITIT